MGDDNEDDEAMLDAMYEGDAAEAETVKEVDEAEVKPTPAGQTTPTTTKKKFKLMKGTEGKFNYLVVAENNGVGLGVRPLVHPMKDKDGNPGIYVGARIRAASVDGTVKTMDVDLNTALFEAEDISALFGDMTTKAKNQSNPFAAAFDKFDFKKHSSVRASTMVGSVLSRAPWQAEEVPAILKEVRLSGKMRDFVNSRLPGGTATVSPDDLRVWWETKVLEEIGRMAKAYAKSSKKHDPAKTVIDYVDKPTEADETPAGFVSGLTASPEALAPLTNLTNLTAKPPEQEDDGNPFGSGLGTFKPSED